MSVVFWFRKDLRLHDHPALNLALDSGEDVFLVATADQIGSTFESLSPLRQNSLRASWSSLKESLSGKLTILQKPTDLIGFAKDHGVSKVFASTAYDTN